MSGRRPKLILHVFPTFAVGGAQIRFASLANHFGRAFRHAVIAMDGNYTCRERLDAGLDICFPDAQNRKGDTLGNLRRFRHVLASLSPDVLATSNWGSVEWAIANAIPLARHIHIEDGFGPEELVSQILRRVLTRRLFLRRSTVVLPSRALQRIAYEIWRLPARRIHYIPNGIDLNRFRPAPEPPSAHGAVSVVGAVAALRPEKNIARLLRAFAALPPDLPARLVIVGDGHARRQLETLAAELDIADRTEFAGNTGRPEEQYRRFDVFALSSDTEQMPLSVLEAMATGLPVCSTNVGDVRHMIAPENLPFVSPLDGAALSAALAQLLRDGELRRRLGVANRLKAEQEYAQERMFRAYGELFEGDAHQRHAA